MDRVQCWRCTAAVPAGISFCGQCGADLRGPACPACGVKNPDGFRFCGHCGGSLVPGLVPAARPDEPLPPAAQPAPAVPAPAPPPAPAAPAPAAAQPAPAAPTPSADPGPAAPAPAAPAPMPGAPGHTAALHQALGAARRRHVTILYGDVVGFTTLSELLPPEFLKWMMDEGLRRCRRVVEHYSGRIQKVAGDTYIAVFGLDGRADHPLQGLKAAAAVRSAMREYAAELRRLRDVTFVMRLALHTGDVVGTLFDDHPSASFTVVGDAVNTVARLQGIAEPDQIVVSESTVAATREHARYGELPPARLKGKAEPVRHYRLLELVR